MDMKKYRMRTFIGLVIVILIIFGVAYIGTRSPANAQSSEKSAKKQPEPIDAELVGKKILFVIAPSNFRDEELFDTKKILSEQGAEIKIVSTTIDSICGMLGRAVKSEGLIANEKADNYDCIVFVGGSGAKVLWNNSDAHRLAKNAVESGKIVAAICIAPVILARAGILKNCDATVFSSAKGELIKAGAKYSDSAVVRCGNIITANGPSAAKEFGETIRDMLIERENKDK